MNKKNKKISVTSKTSVETTTENGAGSFLKIWMIRLFHTALMFFGAYFIIIATVLNIPVIIPFVLGGLGFTVTSTMSNAEYIVAFCAGIFLTLWLVIIDFLLVRAGWKLYKKNIHKTVVRKNDNDGKTSW